MFDSFFLIKRCSEFASSLQIVPDRLYFSTTDLTVALTIITESSLFSWQLYCKLINFEIFQMNGWTILSTITLNLVYNKTSLNRPTMEETFKSPFLEMLGTGSLNNITIAMPGPKYSHRYMGMELGS